jgi:hypothetical protein
LLCGLARRKIGEQRPRRRSAVPPGWWVPVRGSDGHARKDKIKNVLDRDKYKGVLHCFWRDEEDPESRYYALIEHVGDDKIDDLLREPDVNAYGEKKRVERI